MAQIKKHADGGTTSKLGLPEKPVAAAPTVNKNQLVFGVDGEDYNIDETAFNAIAEKAFSTEVQKGNARLRDRGKWMQAFNTKLNEAKSGKFNIQSSGNAVSALTYSASNPEYDGSASDGMTNGGEVAQRTGIGQFLAPRASGSEDKMAAILNNYIGEGILSHRNQTLADKAAKAETDKTDLTNKYNDSIRTDASALANPSLGKLAFGADWDNPQAKQMILNKVWGKETGHVANIDKAFQKYVGKVFDPYYDGKEADYLKAGVDIKGLRDKFSSIYDPTTKQFKTPLNGIGDLYRYSDSLDSIASDSPLFNKKSYQDLLTPPGTVAPTGTAGTAPGATETTQTPEQKRASDAAAAAKAQGQQKNGLIDGIYYSGGMPRTGKYAPTENGLNGDKQYNFYSPEAGFYVGGKKVDQGAYDQYINKLQADPNRSNEFNRIMKQSNNIDDMYAQNNYVNKMSSGFLADNNILQHGEYAFKGFGAEFKPKAAANISSMFTSGGQPLKGGIFNFQSNANNHLGIPDVETAIMTDDGHDFRGIMRKGADGKFRMYKRAADNTLIEQTDPALVTYLANLEANESNLTTDKQSLGNVLVRRSKYTGGPVEKTGYVNQSVGFKAEGGKFEKLQKLQLGGRVGGNKSNQVSKSNTVKNTTPTKYQATKISDLTNSSYQMGTQEKLEATALVADLAGVGLALTGAGSVAAGVTGAVGTSAQLAADIRRDGLDWGDAGNALLGYGLDAASSIPGLGLGAKGAKTLKTVRTASKWLLPALAATGAVRAGSLLTDVISGKKSLTDLSVDDVRTLTNGVHGVMGGARMINNRAAVKTVTGSKLATANGDVDIDASQVKALGKLKGDDQVTQAKLFAIENLNKQGKNVSDVDLKTVRDGIKAKTWNRIPGTADGKTKEVVDIKTTNTGLALKDINDYQGSGIKNRYMRWAIDKATVRNPSMEANEYLQLDNAKRASQFGVFGDYTRGNKYTGSSETGPSSLTGPSSMTGPNSQYGGMSEVGPSSRYGEFSVSGPSTRTGMSAVGPSNIVGPSTIFTPAGPNSQIVKSRLMSTVMESPRKLLNKPAIQMGPATGKGQYDPVTYKKRSDASAKGTLTRKMNKANKGLQAGQQSRMFQNGGILKAVNGAKVPLLGAANKPFDYQEYLQKLIPSTLVDNTSVKPLNGAPSIIGGVKIPALGGTPGNRIGAIAPLAGTSQGVATTGSGNWMTKLKGLAGKVNGNDLSEFGRALATRAVNNRIDTRVEAPMLSMANEISVPVQGNLLGRSAYNNRANEIVRRGGVPQTSDGQLFSIQNLESNRQAGEFRLQGDLENANAIAQSRMMNLENVSRNNAARNEIANRNISTLANSKQAERAANNQKAGMVAQPLLSFWENRNAEALRKEAQDNQIDGQIALSGLSTTVNDIKSPLMNRATALYSKSIDTSLSPEQRRIYSEQYEAVQKQLEGLGVAAKNNALMLMKDKHYIAPANYYTQYRKPSFAKGGIMKEINKANMTGYKERLKDIDTDLKANSKDHLYSLKEVQKLINKALKLK